MAALLEGTTIDELRAGHQSVSTLKDSATVEQALKVGSWEPRDVAGASRQRQCVNLVILFHRLHRSSALPLRAARRPRRHARAENSSARLAGARAAPRPACGSAAAAICRQPSAPRPHPRATRRRAAAGARLQARAVGAGEALWRRAARRLGRVDLWLCGCARHRQQLLPAGWVSPFFTLLFTAAPRAAGLCFRPSR